MKILVIDDNEMICRSLLRGLRRHHVVVEQDPCAAIDLVVSAEQLGLAFDVVLCDMSMPGLDGLGVLEALRARTVTSPSFILMSGRDVAVRASILPPSSILLKPFTIAELEAEVVRLGVERTEATTRRLSKVPLSASSPDLRGTDARESLARATPR